VCSVQGESHHSTRSLTTPLPLPHRTSPLASPKIIFWAPADRFEIFGYRNFEARIAIFFFGPSNQKICPRLPRVKGWTEREGVECGEGGCVVRGGGG
jgi:hypothetical protein